MTDDLIIAIVVSAAWLVVAISALASYRLSWGRMITMGLVWAAIFGAVIIGVEWFRDDKPAYAPNPHFT